MAFSFFNQEIREQKMLSWASAGLLIFVSAFLWAAGNAVFFRVVIFGGWLLYNKSFLSPKFGSPSRLTRRIAM